MKSRNPKATAYLTELLEWLESHPGNTLEEFVKARERLRKKHKIESGKAGQDLTLGPFSV